MKKRSSLKLLVMLMCSVLILGCGGTRKVTMEQEEHIVIGREGEPQITVGEILSEIPDAEQLTMDPSDNGLGNFDLGGDKIVFQSNRDGRWQLYELSNGETRRLLETDSNDENPIYSKDGKYLFFVSNRNQDDEWERDIMVYDPETEILLPITETKGDDWYPVVADQQSLYFVSERDADGALPMHSRSNSIYLSSIDGSTQDKIVGSEFDLSAPTMINENQLIAVNADGQLGIFDKAMHTFNIITPSALKCGTSAYDPVNSWLVFTAEYYGQNQMYLMDLENRFAQNINPDGFEIRYPRFSNDGKKLVYTALVDDHFQLFQLDLPRNSRKAPKASSVAPETQIPEMSEPEPEMTEPAGGEEVQPDSGMLENDTLNEDAKSIDGGVDDAAAETNTGEGATTVNPDEAEPEMDNPDAEQTEGGEATPANQ